MIVSVEPIEKIVKDAENLLNSKDGPQMATKLEQLKMLAQVNL